MPSENKTKKTEDRNAYIRKWRAEHPEKVKEYTKKQSQNPKKKLYNKAYRAAHLEQIRAYSKNRYDTMSTEQKMEECAKHRKKYWEDAEYREKVKTRNRERARRLKAEKLKEAQSINIESGAKASDSQGLPCP